MIVILGNIIFYINHYFVSALCDSLDDIYFIAFTFQPDIVNSLIVVDISPISTPGTLSDYFPKLAKAMKTVNFKDSQNVYKARNIAKEALVASGAIDGDAVGFILMNIGVKEDKSLGWLCNIDVLEKYFPDIASFPNELNGKQYPGKTLFIGGENSRYLQ